ncbi:hypothetical protein SO802_013969 [Lithocarpus litseifolius]|uniref:Uncharacterized protein n=1 Tax=Lithocarpus litseifolius TaxID=425828 RepID=A0AAW2D732_9ROSI
MTWMELLMLATMRSMLVQGTSMGIYSGNVNTIKVQTYGNGMVMDKVLQED